MKPPATVGFVAGVTPAEPAQLSQQLRVAVRTKFPASGETPEVGTELWTPNLTDP